MVDIFIPRATRVVLCKSQQGRTLQISMSVTAPFNMIVDHWWLQACSCTLAKIAMPLYTFKVIIENQMLEYKLVLIMLGVDYEKLIHFGITQESHDFTEVVQCFILSEIN